MDVLDAILRFWYDSSCIVPRCGMMYDMGRGLAVGVEVECRGLGVIAEVEVVEVEVAGGGLGVVVGAEVEKEGKRA